MTFQIPLLSDLVARARAAFSGIPGADAWLPLNNLGPTAKIVGESVWDLFGRLSWALEQAFPLTAEGDYLERHASQVGLRRREASPASGFVAVTTTDAADFPAGTPFQRSDGVLYVSTVDLTFIGAGTLSVAVVAAAAGSASNGVAGTPLAIVASSGAPATGPGASTATAAIAPGDITMGLDVEADGVKYSADLATLRGRVLFRLRNPPRGGDAADYVLWASDVSGVTRVYIERLYAGPGTVRVFPIFDDLFASAGGVADSGHIAAVALALAPLQPAAASVAVAAPTAQVINVTVSGLVPNTTAVQQAAVAELADAFRRLGRVSGVDPASDAILTGQPFLAAPFVFSQSWIWQAVADATGEQRHAISSPAADVTIAAASIPVLGTVSFI